MKIYQADAFTNRVFKGNPAAVLPLNEWLEVSVMQQIAAENNLSETVFIKENKDRSYGIRWFTPETEVDLCGHATLAAAHILFDHLGFAGAEITFQSISGTLTVKKKDNFFLVEFSFKTSKICSCTEVAARVNRYYSPLHGYTYRSACFG
jgi:PhzF family phenazine biosynthesis protein